MRFPVFISMDGREYIVRSLRVLKTGERIAVASVRISTRQSTAVQSPSVLLRLARRVEEMIQKEEKGDAIGTARYTTSP